MEHSASRLKRSLRKLADPRFRESQQRFFREPIRSLGGRTGEIRRLAAAAAREYRQARLPWLRILPIAEQLWRGLMFEERILTVALLSRFRADLGPDDWPRSKRWIDSLSNWAETDSLCADVLGPILERDPSLIRELKGWTRSPNRWRRRASAVALVRLARRGRHIPDALEMCDRLASDRDDMVEKAVGWLLKEASRTKPKLVADYVIRNAARLSRTTVRYACELMPTNLRRRVLAVG